MTVVEMADDPEKAPSVTVLLPTIGRLQYFAATRRSLESQTRGDFRVLVLDNGSPAESRDVFARWAAEDRRVEIARVETRLPMFVNFNRGMQAVKTEFVTFFHDDDVYLPRYLEVLVGALEAHPAAAFAGSNWDQVDHDGEVTDRRRFVKRTELWDARRYTSELVSRGRNFLPMPGIVYRRRAFGPEGWDPTISPYWGDCILLMRAAEEGGVVVVDESVIQIRRHDLQASTTSMSHSASMKLRRATLLGYLDEYLARHPDESDLVARLRKRFELVHRAGMFMGWTLATDDDERHACASGLGDTRVDRLLGRALSWAGDRGLRPPRPERVMKVARMAAGMLRL